MKLAYYVSDKVDQFYSNKKRLRSVYSYYKCHTKKSYANLNWFHFLWSVTKQE